MYRCWILALAACAASPATPADDDDDAFWQATTADSGFSEPAAGTAQRVAIAAGATDNAELVKLLPVGRSEDGADRRVVMRLSPGDLPNLQPGDRLFAPAEVQITTRCDIGQVAPGCGYNPNVAAMVIVTGNRDDTTGAGTNSIVLARESRDCTKASHHCMFVFTLSEASTTLAGAPCIANNSCYVNLVMWAWHPDARPGNADVVLVGQNDGNYLDNGNVDGDSGRLMAIRERGITAADRAMRETSGGGSVDMNLQARPVLIFSHKLQDGDIAAGEQFAIEAKIVTDVSSRARFSTMMFVTKDPHQTDANGFAAVTPTHIGEGNGFNCTAGTTPCTTRKVSVFRADRDIPGPVFVNIIAQSEVPGGAPSHVTVRRRDSWVRSVRYSARFY